MTRIATILISLLLAASDSASGGGQRYALVIGVNECPHFHVAQGVPARPLRGAESDARSMAKLLKSRYGFADENVELLLGEEASYAAIQIAMGRLKQKVGPGDCVVIYFSGHGTQLPDRAPLDESEDGLDEALCLADASDDGENLLIDDELGRWLDEIHADELTVIFDCCHSGTATKDGTDDLLARYLPFPGVKRGVASKSAWRECRSTTKSFVGRRSSVFACQAEQQAYERRFDGAGGPTHGGQFTHFLLQKLAADGDSLTSNAQVVAYARDKLNETFNRARNAQEQQQPLLECDDKAAPFILGRFGEPAAGEAKPYD
jgi:hypothetical protein